MCNGRDFYLWIAMMLIVWGSVWFLALILGAVNYIFERQINERARNRKVRDRGGGK